MLRMTSEDGLLFELRIVGYQFPELETEEYDSNWLLTEVHVVHPRGEWTTIDPCLQTNEVEGLAAWFDAIAQGKQVNMGLDFIEPNLSFRLLPSGLLRIYVEFESRPLWAKARTVPAEHLHVEFSLSRTDLEEASGALRRELQSYPERAKR